MNNQRIIANIKPITRKRGTDSPTKTKSDDIYTNPKIFSEIAKHEKFRKLRLYTDCNCTATDENVTDRVRSKPD